MRSTILRAIGIAIVVSVLSIPAGVAHAAKPPPPTTPANEYLSLGDSLAYGFQERIFDRQIETGNFDAGAFRHGYTDELAKRLRKLNKNLHTTNLGCPGERTDSFLDACGFAPLHEPYDGSQLDAALEVIAAHPGQVGTISIALGANDLLDFVFGDCGGDQACVDEHIDPVLADIRTNYGNILRALRKAAPNAVIILLQYYDPLAVDGTPSTNLLKLNAVIARAAKPYHAKLANAFPPFNLAKREPQTLCWLTLMCNDGDIHASNAGYKVIGDLMYAASGYTKGG